MSGYSKGPWYARLGEFHFTNSGQRPIVNGPENSDQEYDQIALVSTIAARTRKTPYNAPDAVRDANARLIAAAPDLLEALKAFLVDPFGPTHPHAVRNAQAAVRKAEAK